MNGRPVDGFVVYYRTLREARAGGRLRLQVQGPRSAGTVRRVRLHRPAADQPTDPPWRSQFRQQPPSSRSRSPPGFWVAAVRIDLSLGLVPARATARLAGGLGVGASRRRVRTDERLSAALRRHRDFFSSHPGADAHALRDRVPSASLRSIAAFPWLKWIVAGYLLLVASLAAIASGCGCITWPGAPFTALPSRVPDRRGGRLRRRRQSPGSRRVCRVARVESDDGAESRCTTARVLLLFVGAVPGVAALLILLLSGRLENSHSAVVLLPPVTMIWCFP